MYVLCSLNYPDPVRLMAYNLKGRRAMGVALGSPALSVIVTYVAWQQWVMSITLYLCALRWLLCVSNFPAYSPLASLFYGCFCGRWTFKLLFASSMRVGGP